MFVSLIYIGSFQAARAMERRAVHSDLSESEPGKEKGKGLRTKTATKRYLETETEHGNSDSDGSSPGYLDATQQAHRHVIPQVPLGLMANAAGVKPITSTAIQNSVPVFFPDSALSTDDYSSSHSHQQSLLDSVSSPPTM